MPNFQAIKRDYRNTDVSLRLFFWIGVFFEAGYVLWVAKDSLLFNIFALAPVISLLICLGFEPPKYRIFILSLAIYGILATLIFVAGLLMSL